MDVRTNMVSKVTNSRLVLHEEGEVSSTQLEHYVSTTELIRMLYDLLETGSTGIKGCSYPRWLISSRYAVLSELAQDPG
jgi:hypothetical protein